MEKGNYLIWSYMRCFDHRKKDYGIEEYLQKIGRKPDGFCALVVHPDFVHQHPGMEKEHVFPPHLCGYRGDSRRLDAQTYQNYCWSNYQIKGLVDALHSHGMKIYVSVMGLYYLDIFHKEWLGEHQELLLQATEWVEELVALKRLKDGTYYEDFFVSRIMEVLRDYGMDGVHLCDRFSPTSEPLADGDYSSDMVEQFVEHTGTSLPAQIQAGLGDDCSENKKARQKWIWGNHRAQWLRFYDWRWTGFYEKLCGAVHSIGGKVSTLGMYVSDPLRSMYSMGVDAGHLTKAGVDFFTANILPTSVNMNGVEGEYPFLFHRYMTIIPSVKGQAPDAHIYQMLGVRDEEEEWDVFHHAPNQFERDVYTAMSYQIIRKEGIDRCIDKPFVTLGDSIGKAQWDVLNQYFDTVYSLKPQSVISPVLFWSDGANDRMLDAHIATRRPSGTQLQAYLQENGAYCGGVIRWEDLAAHNGPLFVPTFDLLDEAEREELLHRKYPMLALAPAEYDISGLDASVCLQDRFSSYPQKVFLLNVPAPETLDPFCALLAEDDGTPNLPDESQLHDEKLNVMYEMYSQKVTLGFRKTCALLLRYVDSLFSPFTADTPLMVFREKDDVYRVLVFNKYEDKYHRAMVTGKVPMKKVEVLSSFPYRGVQFVDSIVTSGDTRQLAGSLDAASGCAMQIKVKPAGVSVIRVSL